MRKWLKRLGLALLFSLLVGLAIGTWLRLRLERPVYYIGAVDSVPGSLLQATNDEDPRNVEALLDLGADLNLRGFRTGRTALMVAAERSDIETVDLLIKRGADVNMKCSVEGVARERFMRTSRIDFVFFVLARTAGVNIGIGNYKDKTALILAVESEAPEERKLPVVRLLLESGADAEISSKLMHRAMGVAREMEHDQTLQLLQQHTSQG